MASRIEWDQLQDRSVIITGSASGLGAATATKFIEHGAYVTIADMSEDDGRQLAEQLGSRANFVKCNTSDWNSSATAFQHASQFAPSKTLDIVVLFAGVGGENKSLIDIVLEEEPIPAIDGPIPTEAGHKAIDINLTGVYMSTYLALHYFRLPPTQNPQSSFKKSLILISSIMGYIDLPYNTGYAASKFGVRGLFRSLRQEIHKLNARVNNIAPGYILTPLTKRVHGIERAEEVSKATGYVLPWAPIEFVVEGVGRCAVDEGVDGRTFAIVPSGVIDMEEDYETGYGGRKWTEMLEQEGFTKMPSLFPAKHEVERSRVS